MQSLVVEMVTDVELLLAWAIRSRQDFRMYRI